MTGAPSTDGASIRTTGIGWAVLAVVLLVGMAAGGAAWVGTRSDGDGVTAAGAPGSSPADDTTTTTTTAVPVTEAPTTAPPATVPPTAPPPPVTAPPQPPAPPPPPVVTASGVGPLEMGMSQDAASATGAIGGFETGCTLGDPFEVRAPLVPPLEGWATFNEGQLTALSLTGGAVTEFGIAPGATVDAVLDAYAVDVDTVDTSVEEVFGIWTVFPFTNDGGHAFVVDPATERVTSIEVPRVRFCE